jgi:MerR family copper efflux transcriptional regulator
MRIGQAAVTSGLSVKAIRYYDTLGLLGALKRTGAYRDFSAADVQNLKIVARCRNLGFTLSEVKRVLELVSTAAPQCPPPDAMLAVVDAKLDSIRSQIRALRETEQSVAKVKRYIEARDAESPP